MWEVPADRDPVFQLPKREDQTLQEENILWATLVKGLRNFRIGAAAGFGVAWAATWRLPLSMIMRESLLLVASVSAGVWKIEKSMESCLDDILDLEGTRIQREVATFIMQKGDRPAEMKLVSKRFYVEEVFDDSTTDRPKLRFRHRNVFIENISYSERTTDTYNTSGNSQQSHDPSPHSRQPCKSQSKPSSSGDNGLKDIISETKQASVKPEVFRGTMGDPLDFIFGTATLREEIHHPSNSTSSTKVPASRSHRRVRRWSRHRRHHQKEEVPLD